MLEEGSTLRKIALSAEFDGVKKTLKETRPEVYLTAKPGKDDIDDNTYIWANLLAYQFGVVVVDEGHHIKYTRSKAHKSVILTFAHEY